MSDNERDLAADFGGEPGDSAILDRREALHLKSLESTHRLRQRIVVPILGLMVLQVLASNAIFVVNYLFPDARARFG